MIFSFMQIGVSLSHWNHHAFTNQKNDPDVQIFSRFKNLWSRMFLIRTYANRIYIRNTLRMALGKKLDYPVALPFTEQEIKHLAIFNLALSLLWTIAYLVLIIYNPAMGIICIIIPHILTVLYSSIRSYLEHADTGNELFDNSRTRKNIFFTIFYFGNNYHLEHHLYPRVPCYNLPAVHCFLSENGYFKRNNTHIVGGIMEAYKFATGKYQYPTGY
jgi:fatty acid desaturase